MRFLAILLVFLMLAGQAFALHPDEVLADAALEARARELTRQVRCLVCQGESIDESAAPLAGDLRRLVRARLSAGDSDAEVLAYLTDRYGDYILMKPPFKQGTLVLWLAPFAVLAGAAFMIRRQYRAGKDAA